MLWKCYFVKVKGLSHFGYASPKDSQTGGSIPQDNKGKVYAGPMIAQSVGQRLTDDIVTPHHLAGHSTDKNEFIIT